MDPHAAILVGQTEAATHDGAILVLAGVGTGKNRTLIAAVAWRIQRAASCATARRASPTTSMRWSCCGGSEAEAG